MGVWESRTSKIVQKYPARFAYLAEISPAINNYLISFFGQQTYVHMYKKQKGEKVKEK